MAQLSPSTVAINTVAHHLANALEASTALDAAMSEDLRALLRIAAAEVDRVRKASRRAAIAAKRANGSPSGKKSKPARGRTAEAEARSTPAKSRRSSRKLQAVNGMAAH